MARKFALLAIAAGFLVALGSLVSFVNASVSLPWSTTYNCGEWEGTSGLSCSGLQIHGVTACDVHYEQITSSADYSGGGGGRGQRHWENDGQNHNTGGFDLYFNSAQSQLWIRWYMRYQSGFAWNPLGYDKIFDIASTVGGYDAIVEFTYDRFDVVAQGASYHHYFDPGWTGIMGGSTSDGQFHCYEVHLKMDTNGANGIAEFWLDGIEPLHFFIGCHS